MCSQNYIGSSQRMQGGSYVVVSTNTQTFYIYEEIIINCWSLKLIFSCQYGLLRICWWFLWFTLVQILSLQLFFNWASTYELKIYVVQFEAHGWYQVEQRLQMKRRIRWHQRSVVVGNSWTNWWKSLIYKLKSRELRKGRKLVKCLKYKQSFWNNSIHNIHI